LLAVSVTGDWEGDWQTAQGNERSVVAAPVGEDEVVYLEVASNDSVERMILSDIPLLLRLSENSRYRVVKEGSGATESLATTVEVVLSNGKTPS
jgi:hypothetical protein